MQTLFASWTMAKNIPISDGFRVILSSWRSRGLDDPTVVLTTSGTSPSDTLVKPWEWTAWQLTIGNEQVKLH